MEPAFLICCRGQYSTRRSVTRRITLDQGLREKLGSFEFPIEICDEHGKPVARVYPVFLYKGKVYEGFEPQFDEAELEKEMQSDAKRYTTEEVLEHLKKLGNS